MAQHELSVLFDLEPNEDTLRLCTQILELWVNANSKRDIEIWDMNTGSEMKKRINLIERSVPNEVHTT